MLRGDDAGTGLMPPFPRALRRLCQDGRTWGRRLDRVPRHRPGGAPPRRRRRRRHRHSARQGSHQRRRGRLQQASEPSGGTRRRSGNALPVAIETSRGLLVAALRTGRRKKPDPGDAPVPANILRTDMHAHRPLPADSELAQVHHHAGPSPAGRRPEPPAGRRPGPLTAARVLPAALHAFQGRNSALTGPDARVILTLAQPQPRRQAHPRPAVRRPRAQRPHSRLRRRHPEPSGAAWRSPWSRRTASNGSMTSRSGTSGRAGRPLSSSRSDSAPSTSSGRSGCWAARRARRTNCWWCPGSLLTWWIWT
ncbi:hypothetical protein SUDANB176_07285 [Streptomyces sp. enrichment culture]